MKNIEFEIEWTEAASKKLEELMQSTLLGEELYIALPPIECLPLENDILFLGPRGKQYPFIVVERQYHHEGKANWTIILILDVINTH
ncbi:DNA-binding protein [Candidatus Vallotiella sp. (ex Adelges kitamiensis)]|uniref:DNA-binding protein n=1 Tax=Candidatus Vallotiella sp. (ex Adelges kitamiensis) TaxID=2864217 RepID=UPI001CE29CAA|nr:DNA-binding protein [Candidatus Vallotia sp. (ex Adelges kitamiensis)]